MVLKAAELLKLNSKLQYKKSQSRKPKESVLSFDDWLISSIKKNDTQNYYLKLKELNSLEKNFLNNKTYTLNIKFKFYNYNLI